MGHIRMLTGPRKPVVLVLIPLIVTESPPVLLIISIQAYAKQ
jgi:hypothetical protein